MVAQVVLAKGRLVLQEPRESGRSPVLCLVWALSIANFQPEATSGAKLRPSTAPPMGSQRGSDIQRQFCVAWVQCRAFAHCVCGRVLQHPKFQTWICLLRALVLPKQKYPIRKYCSPFRPPPMAAASEASSFHLIRLRRLGDRDLQGLTSVL